MKPRIGDWMQTYTGRQFWPLDPRADEVCIEDIAHALSLQCRFSGHCRTFYSVAEHSVRVSRIVQPEHALSALLHDAAEAYLVDLPRPIKRSPGVGPAYRIAEEAVHAAVCGRFGVPFQLSDDIHMADEILLMTEARDLMAKPPVAWKESGVKPLVEEIVPWSPETAEHAFILRYESTR